MNSKQIAFKETARAAIARLEKIKIKKSRNPFSKRGPIAAMFRNKEPVSLERMGDKLLDVNPSDAKQFFYNAIRKEKSEAFRATLLLKAAAANLLSVSSTDYTYASMELLKSAAQLLYNTAPYAAGHGNEMSASLYDISGEIRAGIGHHYSAYDSFVSASNSTNCPRMQAAYREKAADSTYADGGPEKATIKYTRTLGVLKSSPMSDTFAKSRIYSKMAECAFSMGNWRSGQQYLQTGGRGQFSAEYEADARRALHEERYDAVPGVLEKALRGVVDISQQAGVAFTYANLLRAYASKIAPDSEYSSEVDPLLQAASKFMKKASGE